MITRDISRPTWATRPAVIVAGGPSLSDEQLRLVEQARNAERVHAIAVNNTCERAPWADVAYFGDYTAIKHYRGGTKGGKQTALGNCCREWWTISKPAAERWKLQHAPSDNRPGFGKDRVSMNSNSGAQAINLAMLFGAKRVLLLGFDMRDIDGKAHWFGQHPQPLVQVQLYDEWIYRLTVAAPDAKARGVEIINCTPGSAMECFDKVPLEEAIASC